MQTKSSLDLTLLYFVITNFFVDSWLKNLMYNIFLPRVLKKIDKCKQSFTKSVKQHYCCGLKILLQSI